MIDIVKVVSVKPAGGHRLDVRNMYVSNAFNNLASLIKTGFDTSQNGDGTDLRQRMVIEGYEGIKSYWGLALLGAAAEGRTGDLGMLFKQANPFLAALSLLPPVLGGLNKYLPMIDEMAVALVAARQFAKGLAWYVDGDPLILDLDGDGIETTRLSNSDVYFDLDGDLFAERTGWLDGDDGFLALDKNGNGRIDDISELFGDAGTPGLEALAAYDDNADGVIDAADLIWSGLRIWRDLDQDGVTDDGELASLDDTGIVSLQLGGFGLDITTPQGNRLVAESTFTWSDGGTGALLEAIFALNDVDTRFNGEAGAAAWMQGVNIDSRGLGNVVNLAIAASNDFELGEALASAAASIPKPKPDVLRSKRQPRTCSGVHIAAQAANYNKPLRRAA